MTKCHSTCWCLSHKICISSLPAVGVSRSEKRYIPQVQTYPTLARCGHWDSSSLKMKSEASELEKIHEITRIECMSQNLRPNPQPSTPFTPFSALTAPGHRRCPAWWPRWPCPWPRGAASPGRRRSRGGAGGTPVPGTRCGRR